MKTRMWIVGGCLLLSAFLLSQLVGAGCEFKASLENTIDSNAMVEEVPPQGANKQFIQKPMSPQKASKKRRGKQDIAPSKVVKSKKPTGKVASSKASKKKPQPGANRALTKGEKPDLDDSVPSRPGKEHGADGAQPPKKAKKKRPAEEPLEAVAVAIKKLTSGFPMATDMAFLPGNDHILLITNKAGDLHWVDLRTDSRGMLHHFDVLMEGEQGLLSILFHPDFSTNRRVFFNATPAGKAQSSTEVSEFKLSKGPISEARLVDKKVLLTVPQPYSTHNGGDMAFGLEGYLYIALGDGGKYADPHGHGQNLETLLGSILRIDVDKGGSKTPYAIPPDNPFVAHPTARPEIWAYGLRNPWRIAIAPDGRLIAADVGQRRFEEVDVVGAGDNMGWNVREGMHCFEPEQGCATEGFVEPIYEYGRSDGQSIIGGFVYTGELLPHLKGRYIFSDFVTGRIWSIDVPQKGGQSQELLTLGRWPISPTTFAQDSAGEIYIADFGGGAIYRLQPRPKR